MTTRSPLVTLALILLTLALLVGGGYLDVTIMLVGGILRIAHGASGSPVNTGEIVWGVVRVLFSGVFIWVGAVLSGILWAATS